MIPLWIIGSGGHATVVIDTARATGAFEVIGCLDDDPDRIGMDVLGVPVVGPASKASISRFHITHGCIAIGSNPARHAVAERLGPGFDWPTIVHPLAYVAASATLGEGSVVFAGAVIQPQTTVGQHVICNTACSVDHDAFVGDFAHIGPGSHLAGNASVGRGTALGIGSSMIPGASIGEWSIVGAGATVIHDLPANVTAVGTPATIIAQRPVGWHLA